MLFKSPRHIIASVGALVTIQGLIFTIIEHSLFSLAFTLLGLVIVAGGLHIETHAAARQARDNLGPLIERVKASLRERISRRNGQLADADSAFEDSLPVLERDTSRTQRSPRISNVNYRQPVVIVHDAPLMLWSPGIAAILSLFLPGLGQLYKRQPFNAIAWFVLVGLGYWALVVPGVVLHFCCVLGALSGNPILRR